MKIKDIEFPEYIGTRCLMMPYIQGNPDSVPAEYQSYREILASVYFSKGEIGFLTIDESHVTKGIPHRGARAKFGRALHTEAGKREYLSYRWGGGWGSTDLVNLERNVEVMLANNMDDSCAIWDAEHENTSWDGDIGVAATDYPYGNAIMLKRGEVYRIGIFTPHESLPVRESGNRQFLRIISSGVHGREPYFTENPLLRARI